MPRLATIPNEKTEDFYLPSAGDEVRALVDVTAKAHKPICRISRDPVDIVVGRYSWLEGRRQGQPVTESEANSL